MSESWSEANSADFIDYGRYFVPARARQISTIASLIPAGVGPAQVLELSCGEGLLAEAILWPISSSGLARLALWRSMSTGCWLVM